MIRLTIFSKICFRPRHGGAVRTGGAQSPDAGYHAGRLIALCDAGTGIGKTYAYLAAGIVFHQFHAASDEKVQPILISTSSIALQNAVLREYLPLLSDVLAADSIITEPIQAVIWKGKSHYACDERLERRLAQVNLQTKNPRAAKVLLSLRDRLDCDKVPHLSGYDRDWACVPKICDCKRENCRYQRSPGRNVVMDYE